MVRWIVIMCAVILSSLCSAQEVPEKIAIIKADDIRGKTTKWEYFFSLSKEKGVKVSAGIVGNSLAGEKKDYFNWLNHLQSTGQVEFWNHGWDHKRWKNDGAKEIREFRGSGYAHQKKHFEDAQNRMKEVLGVAPVTFGSPYNATDADTAKVMKENRDIRLFFCYGNKGVSGKVPMPMNLRGENDGTGKPDFEKFKAQYEAKKNLTFSAIQFHPNNFGEEQFDEYGKILDFLIAEGWTFMLPAEYLDLIDKIKRG